MTSSGSGRLGALEIVFRAGGDLVFQRDPNYLLLAACAAAVDAVPSVSSETKRRVHEGQPKPFALSPLIVLPSGTTAAEQPAIPAGTTLSVRLHALEAATLRAFLLALAASKTGEPLRLDRQPLHVLGWRDAAPPGAPFARGTYAELLTAARPASELGLRLVSPAAIRTGQDVLPAHALEPRHFFGAYFARWRVFSPAELAPFSLPALLAAVEAIDVSGLRPAPAPRLPGKLPRPAYLGEVRFRIAQDGDAAARLLAALTAFAAFCGTGAATAMGMGQTHRLA